jgi:hypothetical protein
LVLIRTGFYYFYNVLSLWIAAAAVRTTDLFTCFFRLETKLLYNFVQRKLPSPGF